MTERRSRRAFRRALAVAMSVCVSGPAVGRAEAPRVLFVAATATPFSGRVRAEIEAMGFLVEQAGALGDDPGTAVAAARVVEDPPPRRVELWIAGSAGGRFERRAEIQPTEGEDEATQTVRASEQLRAFFQPLRERAPGWLGPPPPHLPFDVLPPEPVPLPPVSAVPDEPQRARFVVGAALAVPFEPGGPGLDLAIRGRWMATRVIGLGAVVSVPIAGSTLTFAEGSASVSAVLFGVELWAVLLDARLLRIAASAGFGGAWLRTSGSANAPYLGKSDGTVTGLPFAGAEVAPWLTGRLRLVVGGHVGLSLPKTDVAFAGHTVAAWGRPLGLFSGGVSLDF